MIELKDETKQQIWAKMKDAMSLKYIKGNCPICHCTCYRFFITSHLVEMDGQTLVQLVCPDCGYSMFLNYNVLMKRNTV